MENLVKVYFFGDSICFGQGVSVHKTWISAIARRLEKELGARGAGLLLQNYSINGNTTRMALERIAYDIQGKNIDILVVQFGINDANIWQTDKGNPRVSMRAFEANLHEIITRVYSFGVRRVILNTNHAVGKTDTLPNSNIVYLEHERQYNEIIRKVAAAFGGKVVLADMERFTDAWAATAAEEHRLGYLLPDMVHLSELGNRIYYEHFYPILKNEVDKLLY